MVEQTVMISSPTHSGSKNFPYNLYLLNKRQAAVLMLGNQCFMHSCGHILYKLHSASGLQGQSKEVDWHNSVVFGDFQSKINVLR